MKAKSPIKKLSTSKTFAGGLLALTLALCFDLGLAMSLGLSPAQPCFAAISQDDRLAKLEVKFFKHTYLKDDDGARLERLEKMIFGEARSGSDDERLKNLAATVPNLNDVSIDGDGASANATAGNAAASGAAAGSTSSTAADSADNPTPAADSNRKVSKGSSGKRGANSVARSESQEDNSVDGQGAHQVLAGESKYPAVTALEQHLFMRDYANEAVGDRLNRLETKVFGKPSRFTDLSERVDALKDKTNIDIAKQPPSGTDWTDDDEDNGRAFPVPKHSEPIARADGDDGRSFSGRDVGSDLRKAFGIGETGPSGGQALGAFGMSGTSAGRSSGNSASGAYGMGGPSSYGAPSRSSSNLAMAGAPNKQTAPSQKRAAKPVSAATDSDDDGAAPPVNPLGLNQQVTSLETAALGKTYTQEPLIDRVARLEKSVFPKEADAQRTLALPDRVARLLQKVPLASQPTISRAGRSAPGDSGGTPGASRHRPSGWIDEDNNIGFGSGSASRSGGGSSDDDDSFGTGQGSLGGLSSMGTGMAGLGGSMGSGMGTSGTVPQQTAQKPGGLSKIINSIGNALNGGFTGGYNVNSSNLRTDPGSGMLVDTMTGNLINPTTGAVVGRSAAYSGAPLYSGVQTGGLGGIGGMGGLGGIGGMGGLGGIGGMGGLGGIGMGGLGGIGMGGIPLGGVGLGGGMPYGSYGGMPYGAGLGGMPYGYRAGMPMGGMGGFNGFNNGFSSPYGMGQINPYNSGIRTGGMGMRLGF